MSNYNVQNKLQKLIDAHKGKNRMPALLPSMHSTSCIIGENVLEQDELSVRTCPVFKEPLLYFFYGKPVYKVASKYTQARTDCLLSPCCFILNSKKISAKYIYPFDTGAYESGIFKDVMPPEINIKNFQLKPDPLEIPDYIQTFFYSNTNYLQGISTINSEDLNNAVVVSLGSMLKSSGAFEFDDRSKTVEIISADNLKLSEAIMAINVPKPFLRNDSFRRFTTEHPDMDVLTYFIHYPTNPSSHNEAIFQKAIEYLSSQEGLL